MCIQFYFLTVMFSLHIQFYAHVGNYLHIYIRIERVNVKVDILIIVLGALCFFRFYLMLYCHNKNLESNFEISENHLHRILCMCWGVWGMCVKNIHDDLSIGMWYYFLVVAGNVA